MDCLRNLSELICYSDIYSELFYRPSQKCHKIQSLNISMRKVISNGLADLIKLKVFEYIN